MEYYQLKYYATSQKEIPQKTQPTTVEILQNYIPTLLNPGWAVCSHNMHVKLLLY